MFSSIPVKSYESPCTLAMLQEVVADVESYRNHARTRDELGMLHASRRRREYVEDGS
jgi:hypothetical protein